MTRQAFFNRRPIFFGSMAALLLGFALHPAALHAETMIGKAAAIILDANSQKPGSATLEPLTPGADLVEDERLKTDESGRIDALFLDGSALTLGANSDITLDRFVYDQQAGSGAAAIEMATGAMRIIGGRITKKDGIEIRSPGATMAIRGGIGIFQVGEKGDGIAVLIYGDSLSVTGKDGRNVTIRRPGFAVRLSPQGPAGEAFRIADKDLSDLLARLEVEKSSAATGALPPISANDLPAGAETLDLGKPNKPILNLDPSQKPKQDVANEPAINGAADENPEATPEGEQNEKAATPSDTPIPSGGGIESESLPGSQANDQPTDNPAPLSDLPTAPAGDGSSIMLEPTNLANGDLPPVIDSADPGPLNFLMSLSSDSITEATPLDDAATDSLVRDLCANAQSGAVFGKVICP